MAKRNNCLLLNIPLISIVLSLPWNSSALVPERYDVDSYCHQELHFQVPASREKVALQPPLTLRLFKCRLQGNKEHGRSQAPVFSGVWQRQQWAGPIEWAG